MNGKFAFVMLIAAVFGAGLALSGRMDLRAAGPVDKAKPRVMVKIGDEEITREELCEILIEKYGRQELSELILKMLIGQEVKKHGVAASAREKSAKLEQKIIEEINRLDADLKARSSGTLTFAHWLKEKGMTLAQYMAEQRKNIRLRNPNLDEQLEYDVVVEKLARYFDLTHDSIRVAHIQVSTRAEADALKKRLSDGGDEMFSALATKHSIDPVTNRNEGILPYPIYKGDYRFRSDYSGPEFEKAAFALRFKGEVGAPVESDRGWHIIRLLDRKEGRKGTYRELETEVNGLIEKKPLTFNDRDYYIARLLVDSGGRIENLSGLKLEMLDIAKKPGDERKPDKPSE